MNVVQRYGFVDSAAKDILIDHLRTNSTHLVIAGQDGLTTTGLAVSEREDYSSRSLADAVLRINSKLNPIRLVDETLVLDGCERRRVYAHDSQAGGVIMTFEEKRHDDFVGAGVLIAHEYSGILAEMLRAYGLPFPANMKRS